MNRNLKTYLTALLVLAIAVLSPAVAIAQSMTLADGNDVFYISSPTPNSWVKGTVAVRWRVYDDEQANVGYEMTLESPSNCAARLGTIATGNASSNAGADVTTTWNTGGPLLDIASVSDGNYCLRTCVSLRNGSTPYSACALRVLTVRNHNLVPQFTNVPGNTTILTTENWQFDVNASDGNGDNVTYRLQTAPSFLRISQQNGLIFTSGAKSPGNYNVTVVIDDGFGGTSSRSFVLTVSAPAAPSSSSSASTSSAAATTSVTSSTETSATSSSGAAIVRFIKPDAQSTFTQKDNVISWEAVDSDGIKSVILEYIDKDGVAKEIVKLNENTGEYKWDVSAITDGNYTLQLKAEDNTGEVTSATSPQFAVNNKIGSEPGLQSDPLITKFVPSEAAQLTEKRPEISAEFTPPQNQTIDTSTFKFFLDNEDQIGWCEVTEQGFKCTPQTDLALGLHKINAEIKSSDGKTAKAEWTFSIVDESQATPGDQNVVNILGRNLPLPTVALVVVICLIALVLLLIPWFLYLLWRRRENRTQTGVVVEPTPPSYVDMAPAVTYETTSTNPATPTVTTNYYYTPQAFDGTGVEIKSEAPVDLNPVDTKTDTTYAYPAPVETQPEVIEAAPIVSEPVVVEPSVISQTPNSQLLTSDPQPESELKPIDTSWLLPTLPPEDKREEKKLEEIKQEAKEEAAAAQGVAEAKSETVPVVDSSLPTPSSQLPAAEPVPNPSVAPAFVEPPTFEGTDPLAPAKDLPKTTEDPAASQPSTPDWLQPVNSGSSNPLPPAANNSDATNSDMGSFGYGKKADS